MELYKKLLERIENGEPIYCNESFAKDLQTIADKHHKQLNIASVDYQREQLADEPMIKFEMKSKILGAGAYTHPNIKG